MPWNIAQKKVIRENPDFTGETIWQQDQQATIKIIANRHDVHDQDLADSISQCLNVNGINEMLATLDMNGYAVDNVADATVEAMAVNLGQMEAATGSLQTDIDANTSGIQGLDTRVSTIETADPFVAQSLQIGGEVNQLSADVTGNTADTSVANRFLLTNNGTINLTITKPTAVRDIGPNYTIEGNIIVSNGATPGVVSIAGAAAGDVLGSNSLVANAKSLLSYIIHNRGGVYTEIYIWTAVTA